MKMSGEVKIAASRAAVWEALNSPEILRQTIPGCEELTQTDPTHLSARVKQKIGPISANFSGNIELSDLKPQESYRISGEGSGGPAGFAKGGAFVTLQDADDSGTTLIYEVDAQVGGKMAQIGSRLIDSTAKKLANKFFEDFKAVVEGEVGSEPDSSAARASSQEHVPVSPFGDTSGSSDSHSKLRSQFFSPLLWAAVALVIIIWFAFGQY